MDETCEPDASLDDALRAQRAGDLVEAEKAYRKAIEDGTEDPEAAYQLGGILEDRGEYKAAAEFYERAMRQGDDYAPMDLAKILWEELGRVDEAEKLIAAACERGDAHAFVNLGALRIRQGRLDEAEEALRKAMEIGTPYAHLHMARLFRVRDQGSQARVEYLRASEGNLQATAWRQLAWGLFDLGYVDDAERFARKGLEEGDKRNYRLLGRILYERGASEEARSLFVEAIDQGQRDVLVEFGILERDLGHAEQAERLLREALTEGDDDAHFELAVLLQDAGRLPEAEHEYQAAIAAEDEEAYRAYGRMLLEADRLADAEVQFRLAVDHGDEEAVEDLAALYERTGRSDDARVLLESRSSGSI